MARGFNLEKTYSDEGISGATEKRKGLDQMLADAKRGHFKVLIVMEISRLARDVRHLLNLLHQLDEIGVAVISIREGIEFNSTMGRAMVAMIGILMSVERDLLRERIKTALAVKKMTAQKTGNGWRCGRPPLSKEVQDKILILRKSGMSIRAISRELGIGKTSAERAIRGRR
jgi:DNA invertase Pin-like site-specific DNA recombinase